MPSFVFWRNQLLCRDGVSPVLDVVSDEVWLLGELKTDGGLCATLFELAGKARVLADGLSDVTGRAHRVVALLLQGERAASDCELEVLGEFAVDRVIKVCGRDLFYDRAACGSILAHLIQRETPQILLAPATAFGRSVLPYAAAIVKAGLTADCTELDIEPETGLLLQTRPAIGGNIMATIKTPGSKPQMATVRPRTFRPQPPIKGRRCSVSRPMIPEELLNPTVKTLSFTPFPGEDESIQEKDAIVAGGRGLRRQDGFDLLRRLASLLNAGVGASRPTVETKWIGYSHQVGLSGRVVSPKIYIAAGISGAVQHLAGMQTASKIISINRDPDAPIFRVSDIAICGDLYEILPLLIKKLEKRKGEGR